MELAADAPKCHNNENMAPPPSYMSFFGRLHWTNWEKGSPGEVWIGGWEAPLEEELPMKELIRGEHLSFSKELNGSNSHLSAEPPLTRSSLGLLGLDRGGSFEGTIDQPKLAELFTRSTLRSLSRLS